MFPSQLVAVLSRCLAGRPLSGGADARLGFRFGFLNVPVVFFSFRLFSLTAIYWFARLFPSPQVGSWEDSWLVCSLFFFFARFFCFAVWPLLCAWVLTLLSYQPLGLAPPFSLITPALLFRCSAPRPLRSRPLITGVAAVQGIFLGGAGYLRERSLI